MTKAIKDDLLPKLHERYARRQREGKTRMLDELCEDYGYERKYASKLHVTSAPTHHRRTDRRAPAHPIGTGASLRSNGRQGTQRAQRD